MSVVMKEFEKLVLAHLKDITGPSLDPLQFAYRANKSVDDAVNMGLHYVLQHLDWPGAYVRILFVDFSSAFNNIIPNLLLPKLDLLSVPSSVCQWINRFLTDRQQVVRLGKYTSSTRTISAGAPQGCVLSPLLFSLYTNDCTSKDCSVKLLKFADDTTLIGLIQDGDESAYRQEVKDLAVWCSLNNLELNSGDDRGLQEKPPCSPPNYHHEKHCDCSGVIQVPEHHHLPGPEVGQSHRLHCEKLSPPPPHSPRTVLIQSEQKSWQNHSGPLTSSTLTLWTVTIWSTLQSTEHQNDQTQKQFRPSDNPSHEHLIWIMVHTIYTLIYLTHILSLHFNCTLYTCTYKTVHCYIPVHTIVNLYIIPYLLVLFITCHSVSLR